MIWRDAGVLAAGEKVHGESMIGKYGRVFSGSLVSSRLLCLVNCGQLLLSELEWFEEGPQDTQ